MNTKKVLAAVALALALATTGCSAHTTPKSSAPETTADKSGSASFSSSSAAPSSAPTTAASSDTSGDSDDPTNGDAPTSAGTVAAAPSTSSTVPGTTLRAVHSPGAVANDIQLSDGQCKMRTVDANVGKYLPDPKCTPGAIDPAVTQDNIESTICKSGYTTTIRPSASDTDKFKVASLRQYGIKSSKTTEYDHLISLQLGGTNAVSNLWVEPNKSGATGTTNPKDTVETKLKVAVCAHKVTLTQAQQAIATDWTTAESVLGL